MASAPLSQLETGDIENVYIFLADAVRHDCLPSSVADRGLSFKSIAHALATPQCLPTIVSGRLPPKHGVTWFQHTMRDLPTIFDIENTNTGYSELLWPGHALQDVLGNPGEENIETAEPPFVVFEHDNGGHAPYPELEYENPAAMLRDVETDELRSHYQESVEKSASRFSDRLEFLEERGVLNETLVIYLADHGQLLGEHGGFFGHGLPLTPETTYVPMTFIHPSLPEGETGSHLLHQVDIYPTIVNLLTGTQPNADGGVLTKPMEVDRPGYSQGVMQPAAKYRGTVIDPAYEARGVWTRDGGHVFVENSRLVRCVTAVYEATKSGNTAAYNSHRNLIWTLGTTFGQYLKNNHRYGNPSVSKGEARALLDEVAVDVEAANERELSEETKQQLADLGYH